MTWSQRPPSDRASNVAPCFGLPKSAQATLKSLNSKPQILPKLGVHFLECKNHNLFLCLNIGALQRIFVEVVYNGELLHFMKKIPQWLLMQNGVPVHRIKLCEEWRKIHCLEKFNWPSNSSHLNPIEDLWKILKDAVQHGSICLKKYKWLKNSYSKRIEDY